MNGMQFKGNVASGKVMKRAEERGGSSVGDGTNRLKAFYPDMAV